MGKSTVISFTGVGFARLEQNLATLFRTQLMPSLDDAVTQGGDDIAFVAQEMAPRDTGTLENAIESKRRIPSKLVAEACVRVRPYDYNDKYHRRVYKYMGEAHEEIQPAGDRGLGDGSLEKQALLNDGVEVGGHFLTRAYEYAKPQVNQRIIKELNDALSKLS